MGRARWGLGEQLCCQSIYFLLFFISSPHRGEGRGEGMDVLNDIKERLEFLKEMGVMELRVNLAPQVKAEFVASKDAPLSERVRECKKCALSSERINADAVPAARVEG